MNSMLQNPELLQIRDALQNLPRADNHRPGQEVRLQEVFMVPNHRSVFDLDRPLVVGNRGMGKSFWAHALQNAVVRAQLAQTFRLPVLAKTDVVFGFHASERTDEVAPTPDILAASFEGVDHQGPWRAILARSAARTLHKPLPERFAEVVGWVVKDPDGYARLLTEADDVLHAQGKRLLLLFDGLDRVAFDWSILQTRLQGLLKVALATQSFRAIRSKIFLRRDQAQDFPMYEFPDGSKLLSSQVELRWSPTELYDLLFKRLRSCSAFDTISNAVHERELLVEVLAGPFMGSDKKRGYVFTWLPTHLADALGEISPRTFLTAWREAAVATQVRSPSVTTPIDHHGLLDGVRKASEDRLAELSQDYPWVRVALHPLRGESVPLELAYLFELWNRAGTFEQIRQYSANEKKSIYLMASGVAESSNSNEAKVLSALNFIGVAEVRKNGKVDVPDIFRVEAGIKRRGGVKPPRRTKP